MPSAVVVGGGIAGLVAARRLSLGGMQVTLLEASDRLGGKVSRHTVAGIELDAGPESFATRRGTVAGLAASLGLADSVVQPNPAGAWLQAADGTAFPLPKTGILGIPGTPLAGDVIGVVGLRAALRAQLDELMLGFPGSKETNLGRLVRRRMGSAVLEQLVAPVVLGIHSRHPDELDVDVVAPGLRTAMLSTGSLSHGVRKLRAAAPAGSAVSGIEGGIYELVEVLSARLERTGVVIRTSSPVAGVDAGGADLASGERVGADHVVLATALSAPADPTIVLATLVLDAPELDAAPRGTGLLVVPGTPGIRAKALTHASAKWPWLAERLAPHRHVVRLSYDRVPLEGLREQARADAERLLGVRIPPESVVGYDHVEWTQPAAAPTPVEGVTLIGEGVAGTGLAAVVAQATSEAERLLEDQEV
ncbi:MAG TPA: FAD-dependent oxidoreductase [Lacisediminihabitans sp.]|uniref:protoporphyrinogen/coproporphyrinogen oxidase n=1 Tax=Lacisediminihabitans sp. TaxID=2787631 RepID=UPI002ED99E4B